MALIAKYIGQQTGRPVIDRTGIQGEYNFQVDYTGDDSPESGLKLPAALQVQLGLRIEAARAPLEMLVVERADKPTRN